MNIAATLLLGFAMSTDAFAAAICKGAALHRPRIREALRTGLIFGVIEAMTPLIGWGLGRMASQYVSRWDHWIAFGLLGILGLRMIRNGFSTAQEEVAPATSHSFWLLALTGLATSMDAMAVGAGLAFVDVDIISTAAIIGMATLTMATTGVMIGRVVGAAVGRRAEIVGGVVLIGIGALIVAEHVGYLTTN